MRLSEQMLKLCHAIEDLPPSEQQTKVSAMASKIYQRLVEEPTFVKIGKRSEFSEEQVKDIQRIVRDMALQSNGDLASFLVGITS